MGRRLAAALIAAALSAPIVVAAAQAAPPRPAVPTLEVSIPGPFAGCNPGSPATTPSTDAVLSLVLPSAFTPGPLDSPVGDTFVISQAEIVSQSPQTVDYTIAAGAAWPDGTPLRPSDLVRTWRERRADRVLADLGYRDVASVRPTSTRTGVVVTFAKPYADWESLFNLLVPAATARAACALPSAAADPSVGPYALISATHTEIVLGANQDWPGTAPAYAHVVVTTDPAAPPVLGHPRATYLPSPSLAQLQAIASVGGYASRMQHDTTVVGLDFALAGPRALSRPIRSALAHLVDRSALVARVAAPIDDTAAPAASHLYGQGMVLYPGTTGGPVSSPATPVQPVVAASGAAAYGDVADPAAAGAALRAHGYRLVGGAWRAAGGQPLSVCLDVPSGVPSMALAARVVATQLRRQGVQVHEQTAATSGAVVHALRAGTCTMGVVRRTGDAFLSHAAASWLTPTAPEPHGLLWSGVDDPVVATEAALGAGMLNPVVAATTWNAMDARLWDLMVSLPLYSPSVFVAWSPAIAGVLVCDSLGGFVGQLPSLLPSSTRA
ncbi:MAG TPA: ABC transporter substrate-binding protein [Acidimicrobiales bacterium]|nr:ABC transporter substrate-binding protein [Acidimicrobiales bacterium]